MAKGIIVVDVPECCFECPMCYHAEDIQIGNLSYMKTYKCRLQKDEIEDGVLHCVLKSKPDWCPIRPVLEKKPLTGDVSNSEKAGNELVRAGWNACIDEILKGVDENGNESV